MSKLLRKPKQQQSVDLEAKYQRFALTENPFPTSPVNKDSTDRRINGKIYETDIRNKEYNKIETVFLKAPQTDPSHLRLGYIWDTSYIGRGNGKSTFLVNLIDRINQEYCLDISDEINKCFAVYVAPESGGRTKTFDSFVDLIFEAIYSSGIIASSLASMRLDAIAEAYPDVHIDEDDEQKLIASLNTEEWLRERGIEYRKLMDVIWKNEFLQKVPDTFPLLSSRHGLLDSFISAESFLTAYQNSKKGREKLDFVFSHLVQMFMAAGFNGSYIFIDDFERVPDFQSARQKRDFATELRSVLLDGSYENARYGFFNMFLVLHAGVPALISEAWSSSGLDQRYPLSPQIESPHLIHFEKLNREHVSLLIKKYLDEYRTDSFSGDNLTPFTPGAINIIAVASEYNAATILRTCYALIEKSLADDRDDIDEAFVRAEIEKREGVVSGEEPSLDDSNATDLIKKATDGR
ncbi:hypothetical protein BMS3Bbin05_00352 [bacterium BMS3Bbin05]|nr:hypothetical protein BMS3Abin06_00008 [bacterium BMS3Abin06]GBE31451.1 hypothetical protein BMS3Bbin05_00352 [bacterium BMS3Bbin05]HDZ02502.1 hypothetical protein [Nitrospirota bacterium]